jgi:DNA-binding transcriptional ArsR family regulator
MPQKAANEGSKLIMALGDTPKTRVQDFLIENKGMDYSKGEIARGARISRTTLFNIWEEIESMGLVTETRRYARAKLYKLNVNSEVVKKLIDLELSLIKYNKNSKRSNSIKNVNIAVEPTKAFTGIPFPVCAKKSE